MTSFCCFIYMASDKTTSHSEELQSLSISQDESNYITSSSVDMFTKATAERNCLERQNDSNEFINQQVIPEETPQLQRPLSEKGIKRWHKQQLKKQGYRLGSKKLGEGGFGVVYKAYSMDKSTLFACKIVVIRKKTMSKREYISSLKSFTSEVQIMQDCSHENIVAIQQYFVADKEGGTIYGYIVMDFADSGSLHAKLKSSGPFDETTARDKFGQTANALQHMHLRGIGK